MISIDWATKVIYIPKNDLTLIQSTPTEIRELNLNNFRLTLKDIEDNVDGIVNLRTHNHNTEVSLGGIVFARIIEIINGYTITFEDGQYAVNLVGANSNVGDVINLNQVSVRSSNSAGLISNQAIEYSSYNGGVTVNKDSGITGTVFPKGTPQAPVNNIPDAILIANVRGFSTIYIKGDYTFDTGDNIVGYRIYGESPEKSFLIFSGGSLVTDVTVSNATVTGIFDNSANFNNSRIINTQFVNGTIIDCILEGEIGLSGNTTTSIIDCKDGLVLDGNAPSINFNGAGNSLAVRNYSGDLTLKNKSGPENVEINISTGGHINLDNTITNGNIRVTGIVDVTDNTSSGATVDVSRVIYPDQLQLASFGGYIHLNTHIGSSGVKYPKGTQQTPVNNLNDALVIAESRGIDKIMVIGTLVISNTDISNLSFIGGNNLDSIIVLLGGNTNTKTTFDNLILTGEVNGYIFANACGIQTLNNVGSSTFPTIFRDCILRADSGGLPCIKLRNIINTQNIHFFDCVSGVPNEPNVTIDINMSDAPIAFRRFGGEINVVNFTAGQTATFEFSEGQIHLESSCTSGTTRLGGIYKLINESSLIIEERNQSITENISISGGTFSGDTTEIASAVWDKLTSDHETANSFGKVLSDLLYASGQAQHSININTELLKNKPNNS